jgi:hypothetical protein
LRRAERIASGGELVAVAVDGEDVLGFVWGLLDLFSQLDDEVVDGAIAWRSVDDAPDFLENFVARYGLSDAFVQEAK